ncbi:MAG: hypothetical protein ACYS71_08725 [Planctomycetota bacterium]|jgi:alpha-amylase/alpha-mannosidase (GH57 family)
MKYVSIFHANLNYAYLSSDMYDYIIRKTYEMIIDTMAECFPKTKYVFEASGYTIEQMAQRTPDVLEKLKDAIGKGRCEFMGSPYAHPMLPNFPREDGLWSLKFSNEIYQKHLGIQPKSFWNPECGWRSYVPKQVADAGYKNLLGDFEAYSRSLGPDGKPLRPEIYEKEHTDEKLFYNFGFKYDLPGDEKTLHFPFKNIVGLEEDRLRIFLRTDRIAQFGVRYFMGMEEHTLDRYLELVKKYSQQPEDETEGALIVFADDAEYIGTNGWFKLKYRDQPDNVFEPTPESKQKLIDLITECEKLGRFTTFDSACNDLPALDDAITFDDDSAWHGAQASTWAETPMARLLRPWQDMVREKLNSVSGNLDETEVKRGWFHLTNSYNSDGQWPPTLPESPHIICPFNYQYCFENLLEAELIIGGIDRSKLQTDPVATLKEILAIQQQRILEKAEKMMTSSEPAEKVNGQRAKDMIKMTMDYSSIVQSGIKILFPAEYAIRANTLIAARKLVGGIKLEKLTSKN